MWENDRVVVTIRNGWFGSCDVTKTVYDIALVFANDDTVEQQ